MAWEHVGRQPREALVFDSLWMFQVEWKSNLGSSCAISSRFCFSQLYDVFGSIVSSYGAIVPVPSSKQAPTL
jgi:hypothetical protein